MPILLSRVGEILCGLAALRSVFAAERSAGGWSRLVACAVHLARPARRDWYLNRMRPRPQLTAIVADCYTLAIVPIAPREPASRAREPAGSGGGP